MAQLITTIVSFVISVQSVAYQSAKHVPVGAFSLVFLYPPFLIFPFSFLKFIFLSLFSKLMLLRLSWPVTNMLWQ